MPVSVISVFRDAPPGDVAIKLQPSLIKAVRFT
jgi:hypothetical protein